MNKLMVLAVAMLLLVTPSLRTVVAQQTKAEQAFAHARELFDAENWGAAAAKLISISSITVSEFRETTRRGFLRSSIACGRWRPNPLREPGSA